MNFTRLDVRKITRAQRKFVRRRKWDKYHTPKNLTTALVCEAAELAELFQWLTPAQAKVVMRKPKSAEAIRDEIGDVLFYLFRLADKLGVDPDDCFWQKLNKSAKKYPPKLVKGRAIKYTELVKPTKSKAN